MHASIIWLHVSQITTGKICLKSPFNTTTMGLSILVRSLKVWLTASKTNWCIIGASSQIINFVSLINFAYSES